MSNNTSTNPSIPSTQATATTSATKSATSSTYYALLGLLLFVVVLIGYNYLSYLKFANESCDSSPETFAPSNNIPVRSDRIIHNQNKLITPKIVSQTATYPEGFVSEKLHKQITSNKQNTVSNTKPKTESKESKESVKSDTPEKGLVKLCIYHMEGCGHCVDIMKPKNGPLSKFDQLKRHFNSNPKVKIYDFKYGRDKEAGKFNAFPVIMVVTSNGPKEYNGPREVSSMAKFIESFL